MPRTKRLPSVTVIAAILLALAAWIIFTGEARQAEINAGSAAALRRPTGSPQLISTEPLPGPLASADGQMCEWMPASASANLFAALQAQDAGGARGSSIDTDRAPVRVIRDSYPTYSAVGVDLQTNEVYLQDENLFGLMVYDRMTNTPPTANFSEPKRRVRGHQTRLEFNCALWVDPTSGDVYSVNNDMVDRMVVFPRGVAGDVPPKRQLHTPHRAFGIAVDESTQELYLTIQHPPQVVVYRKSAADEERPIRILAGEKTQMADVHGIALDTKNNWMFVSNHGASAASQGSGGEFAPPSITIYPLKASGDVAPIRTIEGPKTLLNWPALMYLDQPRGELYVANDMADAILVFKATDSGNVAPARVIQGPKTKLKNPTGIFVDEKNKEVWVSSMGNHSASAFSLTANGNVAPLRTIRGAPEGKLAQMVGNPGGVGYDTKREEILVPN